VFGEVAVFNKWKRDPNTTKRKMTRRRQKIVPDGILECRLVPCDDAAVSGILVK
jgi:hypothetical protein